MTKRQTKKAIYQAIVKEGKSHQQTFEELRTSSDLDLESLATEIAKVPSAAKNTEFKSLIYTYIALLAVVIVLRSLGVFIMLYDKNINMNFVLLLVAIGIVFPVLGIVGALTSRVDSYRSIAIIMILGVVRSFNKQVIDSMDIYTVLVLLPYLAVVILAFIIPTKLQTNFSKKVDKFEFDGQMKSSINYVFDEKIIQRTDLLDV